MDVPEKVIIEKIHCNECRQQTRHQMLARAVYDDSEYLDDGPVIDWEITFEAFQCCGCSSVVLRRTTRTDFDPSWNSTTFFPPAVSRHPPSWMWSCPEGLREVLQEVYRSLDANNKRLPMMGARTLIDMLMVDKVGDAGTFEEKLRKLENLGVISANNREVLAAALDVGHAAAHRGHAPKADEVTAVMDIVENLLHVVYVLPKMAEDLKKTTPPRSKKTTP